MPEGQQRRCRCGGSTGAAHAPAANVKPRGQIPTPCGTSVEGGALARASRPPQPPPNHSLELQVWLVDPTASPAVPEALGHSVRLQKKSISLCRITEQKPLLTPQMLFTCEQHSSCVCPLSFHPAQEEFSNASHLFPHQQEPNPVCQTPAALTEVPGKDISLSSPAAGQQAILHYCFGKIYPESTDVSSRTNIWVVAAEGFSGNEGL